MSVDLGSPAALWLLAFVALVWLTRAWAVGARRSAGLAVMRSAVLVCLAAALAQPVLSRPASFVLQDNLDAAVPLVGDLVLWSVATAVLLVVLFRRAATSALVALSVWLVLTVFLGLIISVIAGVLRPVPADAGTGAMTHPVLVVRCSSAPGVVDTGDLHASDALARPMADR